MSFRNADVAVGIARHREWICIQRVQWRGRRGGALTLRRDEVQSTTASLILSTEGFETVPFDFTRNNCWAVKIMCDLIKRVSHWGRVLRFFCQLTPSEWICIHGGCGVNDVSLISNHVLLTTLRTETKFLALAAVASQLQDREYNLSEANAHCKVLR